MRRGCPGLGRNHETSVQAIPVYKINDTRLVPIGRCGMIGLATGNLRPLRQDQMNPAGGDYESTRPVRHQRQEHLHSPSRVQCTRINSVTGPLLGEYIACFLCKALPLELTFPEKTWRLFFLGPSKTLRAWKARREVNETRQL